MQYLRQSTASQTVLIGPFVDSVDGVTPETGLSIANTDIRLSANGANIVAKNSGGGTHDELGWYAITLNATDTAAVGKLQLLCNMSGALPVFAEFVVLPASTYDKLFTDLKIRYVVHDGNNESSAQTLGSTLEGASAGYTVIVGPGAYELSSDAIAVPAGVVVKGSGRGATIVKSAGIADGTPIFRFGANCSARDLMIDGLSGNEGTGGGLPLSWVAVAHIDTFHAERIHLKGQNDSTIIVFTTGDRSDLIFEDSIFEARNEGYAGSTDTILLSSITGTTTLRLRNCSVYSDGGTQDYCTSINVNSVSGNNHLFMSGGHVHCINTDDTAAAVQCSGAGNQADLYGVSVFAESVNGTTISVAQGSGASFRISECLFDRTLSQGTIVEYGSTAAKVTEIDPGAITTTAIADGALTNAKLADGAISAAKIASDAITSAKVAASALNGKGDWNTATPLDAAGTRTALGLANADLDNQLNALPEATRTEMDDNSTKLAEIVAGGVLVDIDANPVAKELTFVLEPTQSSGWTGDVVRSVKVGGPKTIAFDFRNAIAANGHVNNVSSIAISSGASGGVTFGTSGRYGTQAKVPVTAVTAGTYVIRVSVVDNNGSKHTGDVTLKVSA